MPCGLAAISTVTATTNAIATPRRSATNRRGTMAGPTIQAKRCSGDSCNARATSSRRGSTCSTAACVSTSMGHRQAKATTLTSMRRPKPNTSMASGISATDGIGRATSTLR